ncbi:MAG: UDP-N-acetylglucosamine--N-acetylmuramyl-(pentapeptide) pyrophosphoryl-undecaprenol [Actinomycetota bacterium]|jgi:UDP-N-acetylglucosamine--N-acetylmuramyl-(pentapeptide) pyrophosphoryl-undecaprenol N-acetylglucosamine transferase|nr:UDP-N-acetylglucosamine--N-acetylmuramyl-(pentapeptide) pyrophosphoryl-undecaprenol [Actinomycetota bacterium]
MKVVIAGGGTAGHVNPALALARALGSDDVQFMGTSTGAEARLVPDSGYRLHEIEVRGFDRSRPLSIFGTGAKAATAFVAARRKLRDIGPDVVVGMGGYVSLPASVGARLLGIPVVLHEQNIVLGLANRVSRPFAAAIGVSFEETLQEAGPRATFTGNPVSPDLVTCDLGEARRSGLTRWDLDPEKRTLLVFGGSQGARSINDAAVGLAGAWDGATDLQVLHITGRAAYEDVSKRVEAAHSKLVYRVADYVSPMGEAYAVADLALCRGGATTVAELGVVGLPAIIVPYPHHRDRQQERHGRVLERAGAARVIDDGDATPQRIAAEVSAILREPSVVKEMSAAAKEMGRPDAADRLAELVRKAAS